MSKLEKRTLFVFDFDHTLIDDNVDTLIMSVHPNLKVRENLHSLRKEYPCWTDLMHHTAKLIYEQGVSSEELLAHIQQAKLFKQALKAVTAVGHADHADAIILSDANTLFIEHILTKCGVIQFFQSIISNPAHFDANGRLHIRHYHSHSCQHCFGSPNLCKGQVLTDYLKSRPEYSKVVYVGDGKGDFCPACRLSANDILVCRKDYFLAKKINESADHLCKASTLVVDFVECLGDTLISHCL